MIKITLRKLVDLAQLGSLTNFYKLEKPVAVAWKNRKQPAACNKALAEYNEERLALCAKYGKKDPATGNFFFDVNEDLAPLPGVVHPGPRRLAFDAAIAELLDQEVELPGEPVPATMLKGHLSEHDVSMLEDFIAD